MKMTSRIWTMMAMDALFTGQGNIGKGMPRDFNVPYLPPVKPIPFSFKKFKYKEGQQLPKGCKCERVKLEFIKPSHPVKYKITAEVDIIYGTEKSGKKKLLQYQHEIGYFIYHTDIKVIEKHIEDILIEPIKPETNEQ